MADIKSALIEINPIEVINSMPKSSFCLAISNGPAKVLAYCALGVVGFLKEAWQETFEFVEFSFYRFGHAWLILVDRASYGPFFLMSPNICAFPNQFNELRQEGTSSPSRYPIGIYLSLF